MIQDFCPQGLQVEVHKKLLARDSIERLTKYFLDFLVWTYNLPTYFRCCSNGPVSSIRKKFWFETNETQFGSKLV